MTQTLTPPAKSKTAGSALEFKVRDLSLADWGRKELMRRYARPRGPEDDPFTDVENFPAPSGLPVVAGALAWLDCELMQTCDFGGDHELVIARVTAGDLLRTGHSFTHVRGNGFHY
jgi:flavin reductase (DIM6/NTAB) family NADH-FMN oxidoreductase RutF